MCVQPYAPQSSSFDRDHVKAESDTADSKRLRDEHMEAGASGGRTSLMFFLFFFLFPEMGWCPSKQLKVRLFVW